MLNINYVAALQVTSDFVLSAAPIATAATVQHMAGPNSARVNDASFFTLDADLCHGMSAGRES